MTSWINVRGWRVNKRDGVSKDLMVALRAFASVPGIDAKVLTETSKVALVEISAANLTSIGPDTDARTCTSSMEDTKDYQKIYTRGR